MAIEQEPSARTGLDLILLRGWHQEKLHQLVLRELFGRLSLATVLKVWDQAAPPDVSIEPFGGLFDLALGRNRNFTLLIELKLHADLSADQRRRQRAKAAELGLPRLYILLGPAYFMTAPEPDAIDLGMPELAEAITTVVGQATGAVAELAEAYAERLRDDVRGWTNPYDPKALDAIGLLRVYSKMAEYWPVETRPTKATSPAGPEWIINGNAWTPVPIEGWGRAECYWEIVNGHVRFKLFWPDGMPGGLDARARYRDALEQAARDLGEPTSRTRAKAGKYMTALQLNLDVVGYVVVAGQVDPDRARAVYDRSSAVFALGLTRLAGKVS